MKNFIEKVVFLTVSILLGRFVNAILPFLIVNLYGSSKLTDFIFIAFSISFYFYGTLFNAFIESSVPKLIVERELTDQKHNYIFSIASFSVTFIALYFYHNYVGVYFYLVIGFSFSGIAACGILAVRRATLLAANEKYTLLNILWAFRALTIIVLFIYNDKPGTGLLLFAIALLISDALRLFTINTCGQKYENSTDIIISGERFDSRIWLYILASLILGLNPVIDRLIASYGVSGSITLLELGERIYALLLTAMCAGFFGVISVDMSKKIHKENISRYWQLLLISGFSIGVIALGIAVLIGAAIKGYVGMRFLPKLNFDDLSLINDCLLIYSASIPAFILIGICTRLLLIKKGYLTLLNIALISIVVNFTSSFFLFRMIGLTGIALGTTLCYSLMILIMLVKCKRIIVDLTERKYDSIPG